MALVTNYVHINLCDTIGGRAKLPLNIGFVSTDICISRNLLYQNQYRIWDMCEILHRYQCMICKNVSMPINFNIGLTKMASLQ